jgi:hypothetical protein
VCDARSSRSSLEGGRRVKSGDVASDGERVKDKANADGGFLEAEVRRSTWLALVRRRFSRREKSEKKRDCPHTVLAFLQNLVAFSIDRSIDGSFRSIRAP